ncbi:MAG: hypothetical protein Q8N33_09000 [Rhodocyclaceae bacterium]|nr:hypothetical protein [Rhodocyclaceae bacterium]
MRTPQFPPQWLLVMMSQFVAKVGVTAGNPRGTGGTAALPPPA